MKLLVDFIAQEGKLLYHGIDETSIHFDDRGSDWIVTQDKQLFQNNQGKFIFVNPALQR